MLFKRYKAEGLAHYSYLVGDQGKALLIDPRRDIDAYLEDCASASLRITLVLETHRNEDYVIGSREIESATGAVIYHADSQWDYAYGNPVQDGQEWTVGRLLIKAIHTPGHTPGSMSYLLHDPEGHPWILFTGDLLFSGDVGRMDLLGEDRLGEMAGLMYDSLFNKVLPLGDQVIVCPAHGAGSVCAAEIAERTWTTIGLERRHNPRLQVSSKQDFISQFAKMLERPPYFRKMEELNLKGAPVLGRLPELTPLTPGDFSDVAEDAHLVDTRDQVAYGAGHLNGSLNIWDQILPSFAGWFLDYQKPVAFITNSGDREPIIRTMVRLGFDDLAGFLIGGVVNWARAGRSLETVTTLNMDAFCQLLQSGAAYYLLDVRGEEEIVGEGLVTAHKIHITQIPDRLAEIPQDIPVYIVCSTGYRSMLVASYLKQHGWDQVDVPIGGIEAWENFGCEFDL